MTLADTQKASAPQPDRRAGGDGVGAQGSPIYDELIAELGDPHAEA